MPKRLVPCLALLLLVCAGCGSGPKRAPAIAEAYVGPVTLNLREELVPGASVTATVRHGERLEVLERRRRFAKVRTAAGVEGWTDGRMLLSTEQMAQLRRFSDRSSQLPSQGQATVHDPLNVHTAPNRQAPSFYQIPEEGFVDVVGHRLEPRLPYQPSSFDQEPANSAPPKQTQPVPMDDWSLVRIPDGRAGWALTRMLVMAIPDEVAQYAEGHRITSYFSLGQVDDRGDLKHHWLWTTLSSGLKSHQFDSFRVFVWSLRRHRYETAYIERNLVGYYPVLVHPVEETSRRPGSPMPRFSLIVEERDGLRYRRTYAFQGFRVRMIEKTRWDHPAEPAPPGAGNDAPPAPEASPRDSFLLRIWRSLGGRSGNGQ